jgi:hypothetical protein
MIATTTMSSMSVKPPFILFASLDILFLRRFVGWLVSPATGLPPFGPRKIHTLAGKLGRSAENCH